MVYVRCPLKELIQDVYKRQQGKQTTPNHKVKKTIIKEECDWVRIEKNHEPIITDRDFEVVQRSVSYTHLQQSNVI